MSICFHVFLAKDRLPHPREWSNAITENGFPVVLDTDFNPMTHSGYLPCPDEKTGFEYGLDSAASFDLVSDESNKRLIRDCDVVATFCFGGRKTDLVAAMAASATLTKMTSGVLLDAESGHFVGSESALNWARETSYQALGELHVASPQISFPIKLTRKIGIVSIGLLLGWLIAFLQKWY